MTNSNTTKDVDSPTIIMPAEPEHDSILVQKSKILVIKGELQGEEYMLTNDVFTIGSGPGNDLVLRDTTVSRRHCEIVISPAGCVIRDMGSTNGTIVQGIKITEAFLDKGTEFQLGGTRMVYCPVEGSVEYALSSEESFGSLIGRSVIMRRIFYLAQRYAPTDATILIEGETGTGKEVLAEEIHRHSERADKPFIVIDCATLSKELVESELFGHTKGAFTGANADRVGAFELADGGTILLDEIGDLDPNLRPKLLRVLEKKEIRKVGSNQVKKIDVRIISATNRKLINEVNEGRFREDLYYRLSVVRIELQPLRKRKEDIRPLTERFLKDFHGEDALDQVADFDKTVEAFKNHDWQGNVRELKNLIRIAFYGDQRPVDLAASLHFSGKNLVEQGTRQEHSADRPFKVAKKELVTSFEKDYVQDILGRHDGNISKAAREAGIERAYLQRLIKKYGLKPG